MHAITITRRDAPRRHPATRFVALGIAIVALTLVEAACQNGHPSQAPIQSQAQASEQGPPRIDSGKWISYGGGWWGR